MAGATPPRFRITEIGDEGASSRRAAPRAFPWGHSDSPDFIVAWAGRTSQPWHSSCQGQSLTTGVPRLGRPPCPRDGNVGLSTSGISRATVTARAEHRTRMKLLLETIDRLGGLVSRRQLLAWGVDSGTIDVASWYGRQVMRVRKGWFARSDEPHEVIRAWRVGGRLTCVSALAYHAGEPCGPVLHVEVAGHACQLRDPDNAKRRLGPDAPIVVHWTRHPGPGTRRAVTLQHAASVAAACGTHSAGVPRADAAAAADKF